MGAPARCRAARRARGRGAASTDGDDAAAQQQLTCRPPEQVRLRITRGGHPGSTPAAVDLHGPDPEPAQPARGSFQAKPTFAGRLFEQTLARTTVVEAQLAGVLPPHDLPVEAQLAAPPLSWGPARDVPGPPPPLPTPGRQPYPARERRGLAELHAGRGQRCRTTAEPQGPVAASGPPAGQSRPTAVLVPRTRRRPRAALESEPADGGARPPRKHCQQCASSRSRLSCFAPSPLHPQGNCSLARVCASLVVCCAFQPVLMTAASKPQSQLLLLLTAR